MRGLSSDEFEHRLCTTRLFDPDFVSAYGLEGVLDVAGSFREGLQFPIFRLKRIFEKYQPDIVHTRNWGAVEAVLAARLAGVPIVIHSEHGYEMENIGGFPWRQRIFRWMAYRMTDGIFAVTQDLCEFHAKQALTPKERFQVIYNGVDTKLFSPCQATRDRVRRELGFPLGRIVVGSVGRMVAIKNYTSLLSAVQQLLDRGADLQVLLVGKGPELDSLQKQAVCSPSLAGRVTFVGSSDRVPELLNAMDIFVLPSFAEGMSNTLLEAMSCGLPLVATRAGGNTEVIEDGRSGWLFTPGDTNELVAQIDRLLANPVERRRLGESARIRALAFFSLDGMLQRYRRMYLEAVQKHGLMAPNRNTNRSSTQSA